MALTKVSSGLISADASSVDLNIDAGTLYIDATNNRVGIGTTSPTQPLHVYHATTNGVANFQSGDTGVNISLMDSATTAANYVGIGALGNELTFIAGNGAEKMRIDSSGRVGIGTSSPTGNLVVVNSGGGGLNIGYNATSTNYYDADTQIFRNGSFAEKMRINSSGNVGINTSNPARLLDVFGGDAIFSRSGATHQILFGDAAARYFAIETPAGAANFKIRNITNSVDIMTFAQAGNVGIGTSSPAEKLDVNGNSAFRLPSIGGSVDLQFPYFGATNAKTIIRASGTSDYRQTLAIKMNVAQSDTAPVDVLFIGNSGNVGIGTSTTNGLLTLKNTNPASSLLSIQSYASTSEIGNIKLDQATDILSINTSNIAGGIAFGTGASGTERMRIDSSGNLLHSTTDSNLADNTSGGGTVLQNGGGFQSAYTGNVGVLNRMGSDGSTLEFRNRAVVVGSVSTTSSSTTYNTSSDARLKDVTGSARGLEVINALNPVSYNWKADGKADEGLIAQEVLEIVPNAVSGSEEEYYQMDYSKLVTHLVAGMKEQQVLIEQLQAEVALLKGE